MDASGPTLFLPAVHLVWKTIRPRIEHFGQLIDICPEIVVRIGEWLQEPNNESPLLSEVEMVDTDISFCLNKFLCTEHCAPLMLYISVYDLL